MKYLLLACLFVTPAFAGWARVSEFLSTDSATICLDAVASGTDVCANPASRAKELLGGSDLVLWCSHGDIVSGDAKERCTSSLFIAFKQMESYSWMMRDSGVASPPPPCTPLTFSTIDFIGAPFYTDNSPLVIAGYHIFYGETKGGPYPNVALASGSPKLIEPLLTMSICPKTFYFVVTEFDGVGVESYYSNEVSKTIADSQPPPPPPPPPPPLVLSVITTTAYKKTEGINDFKMNAIGTVPLGTLCNPAHMVDGFNMLIDRKSVTLLCGTAKTICPPSKTIFPTSAYARCALQ